MLFVNGKNTTLRGLYGQDISVHLGTFETIYQNYNCCVFKFVASFLMALVLDLGSAPESVPIFQNGSGCKNSLKMTVFSQNNREDLEGLIQKMSKLSFNVTFVPLPQTVNEMNTVKLEKSDAVLLCHSANRGSTNVIDGLYGEFLKRVKSKVGAERVGLIIYGDNRRPAERGAQLRAFGEEIATKCCRLIIFCGKLKNELFDLSSTDSDTTKDETNDLDIFLGGIQTSLQKGCCRKRRNRCCYIKVVCCVCPVCCCCCNSRTLQDKYEAIT